MPTPFDQPGALRVLITGAAGNIGRALRAQFHGGMYCPMEFMGDTTRIDGGPL